MITSYKFDIEKSDSDFRIKAAIPHLPLCPDGVRVVINVFN